MIIEFLVVAVVLYLVDAYVPMQAAFKTVFHIACVVIAIYYLLAIFGVALPHLPNTLR
jgi:hypothetical protein